ncbi:flagellar basal body-associated FliL family protein [Sulfitobacter delicatus]|uniref:Flagellar protein FliL n=1 Tax=Sulfitobacter delicatus TaxID=218672 RepID=A0A1G7I854_9RHOB|nr:flagellar basal body-associated FliL family protein [Sulfitobacter delicatus]SDF08911.1 hypothetical protein SAMN04489759_101330 [Sulfitobacter delicatus]
MLSKILPVVLLLVGAGAGVGAGMVLRPAPEPLAPEAAEEVAEAKEVEPYGPDNPAPMMEYAKLSNQFVVPIIKDRNVAALVVLSLSIEVTEGSKDAVFQREPKLRDSFLGVLFDHANMGGFEGAFTEANNIAVLRNALREVAQKDMGKEVVSDVLILEIARQDY